MCQDNNISLAQSVTNDIFQSQQSQCAATVSNVDSGDQVILLNSRVGGSVGFEAQITTSASCVFNNTINTSVSNTLTALLQQENSALSGILPSLDGQTNSVDALQTVANYVTQLTENTCNSSVINNQSNSIVYVQGSTVGGNVGFIDNGLNASANCTFNNTTNLQIYNDLQATVTQKNKTIALLALIVLVIAVIIVVGIIVTGFSKAGKKKNEASTELSPEELKLINEYTS